MAPLFTYSWVLMGLLVLAAVAGLAITAVVITPKSRRAKAESRRQGQAAPPPSLQDL